MAPALTALKRLDKALELVRDLGLEVKSSEDSPIGGLLEQIYELDHESVTIIAKTLAAVSTFNDIVRNEISAMEIGERYEDIVRAFNSIRDDSKRLVDQLADGKINTFERVSNVWMKVRRGDIADRFDEIRHVYLDVAKDRLYTSAHVELIRRVVAARVAEVASKPPAKPAARRAKTVKRK